MGFDLINDYKDESCHLRRDIDDLLNKLIDKNEDVLLEI